MRSAEGLYVLLCAMAILPDGMRERFSSKEYLIHFNPLECFNPFTQILHWFALIGRQKSLPNIILVQTTLFYGEWFKIYQVQNFVQIILGHPVEALGERKSPPRQAI